MAAAARDLGELSMAATPAEEEIRPAEALGEESTHRWTGTTSWAVPPACVHEGPQPLSWDPIGTRGGTLLGQGWNRLTASRAAGRECVVGGERYRDPGHGGDRDSGIVPVTTRTFFKGRDGS